jgi:hypothetical protein
VSWIVWVVKRDACEHTWFTVPGNNVQMMALSLPMLARLLKGVLTDQLTRHAALAYELPPKDTAADHGAVDFARDSVGGCSDRLGRHCCKPQIAFLSLSVHSRRDAAENAPITSGWDRIICFHEV